MKELSGFGISPSPWHKYETKDSVCVDDCNNRIVNHSGIGFEHGIANSRLIAAAPDLYEALRMFIELCESYGCDKKCEDCLCAEQPCIIKARAALAKAAGEEVEK